VIGAELGISEITVKGHRGRVMQKMKARSLAELVTLAAQLSQVAPATGTRPGRGISQAVITTSDRRSNLHSNVSINTNVHSLPSANAHTVHAHAQED
jgi:hypothetical protein